MSGSEENSVVVHTASQATTRDRASRRSIPTGESAERAESPRSQRIEQGNEARRQLAIEYGDDPRVQLLPVEPCICLGQLVAIRTATEGVPQQEAEPLDTETVLAEFTSQEPDALTTARGCEQLAKQIGEYQLLRPWGAGPVEGWTLREVFAPHSW